MESWVPAYWHPYFIDININLFSLPNTYCRQLPVAVTNLHSVSWNWANGISHVALSCSNEIEQGLFVWSKVTVHCSRDQVWYVWIFLCKLMLNCKFVLFGWKRSTPKVERMDSSDQVYCFKRMRQELLWDFSGTTAAQVIWHAFTWKIKNIWLIMKLMNACCNHFSIYYIGLFHLVFGEHSTTPPPC